MSKNFYRCLNGGDCDTINGTCICPAGFMGADCSQKVSRGLATLYSTNRSTVYDL